MRSLEIPNELWCDGEMLDRKAEPHYQPLDFHNYPHALRTAELSIEIARIAIPHGANIDISVLPSAGREHDAGFYLLPLFDHSFATKEAFSASIYRIDMASLGMPWDKIELGAESIESTAFSVPCKTDTARCLRQGDLSAGGVLDSPIAFLGNTFKLFRESKRLKEEPLVQIAHPRSWVRDFITFGGISHEILSAYLAEDLALGDFQRDEEGRCVFNTQAARNVNLLVPSKLTEFLARHLGEIISYEPVGI